MSKRIEADVWDHGPVKGVTLLVLLRLADGAGDDHRMVWISAATLAKHCRASRSSVFSALAKLKEMRIIEDVPEEEWPREAHLYDSVVRRIRPLEDWGVVTPPTPEGGPESGRGEGVQNLDPPSEVVTKTPGGVQNLDPTRSRTYGSTKGEPSVLRVQRASRRRTRGEDDRRPTRAEQARRQAAAEKELDPAHFLGMEDSGPDEPAPRPRRKSPHPDSAMGLALEFQRKIRLLDEPAAAASPVNVRALAKNFSEWLREGVTIQVIRSAITAYADVPAHRNPKVVPWKDFLGKRAQLLEWARRQNEAEQTTDRDHWTGDDTTPGAPGADENDRSYWL